MPAQDLHGLALSTTSTETAKAYNHTIAGYLSYRADTPERLRQLLGSDPDFALAYVLRGYFAMLSFNLASVGAARDALAEARKRSSGLTRRELAHIAALSHWVDGDIDRTLATWEQLLDEYPLDVLAFRLHHFLAFWYGRPALMVASADKAHARWSAELAGWPALLACRCFAHEEMGNYAIAEQSGREAIAIAPGDLWAAHGVAHILEMQGRREEGIAWLAGLEPHWHGGNNLKHHLWWHRALYHFERREFPDVLALYDRNFRDLQSPLTQGQPDMYIDVQNAASMLFRLERQGVDVGDRWNELADQAERRIGDCLSGFTLPHWMMALAATRRWDAADRMLEGMRTFAAEHKGTAGPLVRDYALPICEAVLARAKDDPARACDLMRPALSGMHQLGGSHAQQDVLEQLFLDCAVRARRRDDAEMLLARVTQRHPLPPDQRVGYADALAKIN